MSKVYQNKYAGLMLIAGAAGNTSYSLEKQGYVQAVLPALRALLPVAQSVLARAGGKLALKSVPSLMYKGLMLGSAASGGIGALSNAGAGIKQLAAGDTSSGLRSFGRSGMNLLWALLGVGPVASGLARFGQAAAAARALKTGRNMRAAQTFLSAPKAVPIGLMGRIRRRFAGIPFATSRTMVRAPGTSARMSHILNSELMQNKAMLDSLSRVNPEVANRALSWGNRLNRYSDMLTIPTIVGAPVAESFLRPPASTAQYSQ